MRILSCLMVVVLLCVCLGLGGVAGDAGLQDLRAPSAAASRTNPFAGQPEALLAGRKLYLKNCSHCHGQDGRGQKKAISLHSPTVQEAPPGVLFWWVRNGNLRAGMPAWSHLPDQQIWQIVTFVENLRTQ